MFQMDAKEMAERLREDVSWRLRGRSSRTCVVPVSHIISLLKRTRAHTINNNNNNNTAQLCTNLGG